MSSKIQSKQWGKVQPLKTVALWEYQKFHYEIYIYTPQKCRRQKACCWNIYDNKMNTLLKEIVTLCSKEFVVFCVWLCGLEGWCPKPKSWWLPNQRAGSWDRRSRGQIFMRQKVFLKRTIVLPPTQWQGDVENYNWYVPLDTHKKNKTQRSQKGARIELASLNVHIPGSHRTFWTIRKLRALPHGQLACTFVSKDASNSSPPS